MIKLSTEQVAKIVGLNSATLSRYIKAGKIVAPKETMAGGMRIRLWSERDIQRLKETLPKIANGRKTRYQKLREKERTQQSASQPQHAKTARAGGPTALQESKKKTSKKKK
jgi:predicted DNA-binding transcriptional regulator AlpA